MNVLNKAEIHNIFQKIRNGNKESVEELYGKYQKLVINISFSIVKERNIAEEISQIVFMKIIQLSNEKLPTSHELNWLYTVTKNATIEYIRKQNKYIDIDSIYDIANSQSDINEIIDRESFNKIIDSLNDKDKEIVSLKILSNYTFKEIGYMLNIPTGTVQWRYYKSIHTLKILLSNLSLFIVTSMLYISSILKNKENNTDINGNFENNTNHNYPSIDSISPSDFGVTTESTIQLNSFSNVVQVGLFSLSYIFLVVTIIFGIIFAKHQQNLRKKTSK